MLFTLVLFGCPEPVPEAAPEPECTLSSSTLAGRTFIRVDADKEDVWARARFYKDGDTLKLKYNTRALVDMYDYTCVKEKSETLCKADNVDLKQWCQTLVANNGQCSPAQLASLTGASVDAATKAQQEIMKEIDKLSAEKLENMKKAFSVPSNQLRGIFHVKVNKDECRLTVRDTYQTMTQGEVRELDNFVGPARFVETDKDLVFEKCEDHASLVALTAPDAKARPGETKVPWKVGETIPFKHVGPKLQKPDAGCTYTMDAYVLYEPKVSGEAVEPDGDGMLVWKFDQSFDTHGSKIVHLYRHQACGGESELVDVTCAKVEISPAD